MKLIDFNRTDGTKNKGNLGANAILAVSMAVCRVSANSLSLPLYRYISGKNNISMPIPLINVLTVVHTQTII